MYTGNLIDELISTVERAETSFNTELEQASNLAFLCAISSSDLAGLEPTAQLAGVA